MELTQARDYADYFVWAKRNLTSTPEICHAAAQAAVEAKSSGGDPEQAARAAVATRSGAGWQTRAEPDTRRYAEWYDWARLELGTSGEDSHKAAAAAVESLRGNLDSGVAADAARSAVGKETVSSGTGRSTPPVQGTPTGPPVAPAPPQPPRPAQPAGYQPSGSSPPPPPSSQPPSSQRPPSSPPPSGPPPYQPPAPGFGQQPSPGYPYSSQPPPPPSAGYPAFPATPGGYWTGYATGGTDGLAIGSLICALTGILFAFCYGVPGILLGVVALILGRVSLRRIRSSSGYKTGSGLAQAGWIIGIVDMALGALVLIAVIVFIAVGNTSTSG
jgi:hypothetical protein